MATLALTAVGTALGGPIGGMIGSLVGQGIDARLFAPKARAGPRLAELGVQTSSYGTPIPKIFGHMRVAGTVIWSTDLIERRTSGGGGKGRPRTVAYSYSASFAVALSARPLRAVRRIWADGKLLRGAAGDFKTPTGFRLHRGSEDQAPDPLLASAEGETPAYRGLAYAVFEGFELEEYGNRIPSLSFEVEADEGPVTIPQIAAALSDGDLEAAAGPAVRGYAVAEEGLLTAVEAALSLAPLSVSERDGRLTLGGADRTPVWINEAQRVGPVIKARRAAASLPGEVSLTYHDPARDHQAGLQRARRDGGGRPLALAGPVALSAGEAKALAEQRLAQTWSERTHIQLKLGWRWAHLRPASLVVLAGEPGLWKISGSKLGPLQVELALDRVPGIVPVRDAEPGRVQAEPDQRHGPTQLMLVELPSMADLGGEQPAVSLLASGSSAGWRRAAVRVSLDDGASWKDLGQTAGPAVQGRALTALPAAASTLLDTRNTLLVQLLHEEMWLESCTRSALSNNANLAVLGEELIQFAEARPLGAGVFQLSGLLRGRRGTEHKADGHLPGDNFALVQEAAMLPVPVTLANVGAPIRVVAQGIGDGPEGVEAQLTPRGLGLYPPAPVHLRASRESGGLRLHWVRRSRRGWTWSDGGDAPLGEEKELYALRIASGGTVRDVEVPEARYLYTAAEHLQDGSTAPLTVEVRQIGTHGASPPAILHII